MMLEHGEEHDRATCTPEIAYSKVRVNRSSFPLRMMSSDSSPVRLLLGGPAESIRCILHATRAVFSAEHDNKDDGRHTNQIHERATEGDIRLDREGPLQHVLAVMPLRLRDCVML